MLTSTWRTLWPESTLVDSTGTLSKSLSSISSSLTPNNQLAQFISHIGILRSYNRVVIFGRRNVEIVLRLAELANSYQELTYVGWQVSCMAQTCSQSFFLLSGVEVLDIQHGDFGWESTWRVDTEETPQHRCSEPAYVSRAAVVPRLCAARAHWRKGHRGVACTRRFLEKYQPSEPGQQAIEQLTTARQRSGHPVTVYRQG
ncbi:hypothetical protein BJV78DRAFT_422102 [Lactifluus subvellereus]|nr:hypothetical protein BJV78DRAFT_422102 [Lactifluus subvellereus]